MELENWVIDVLSGVFPQDCDYKDLKYYPTDPMRAYSQGTEVHRGNRLTAPNPEYKLTVSQAPSTVPAPI